jgi:RNA polymerase sigma-70 factor (ECF subfamily)
VTDAELVARARNGDHAAFGDLVDRHRTAVYRAALAALRLHAEAEDAAQDAFVLAWRRLGSFRGDASFKTWLLTIAWHQAINRRRTLGRWWKRTAPLPQEEGGASSSVAAGSHSYVACGFSRTSRTVEGGISDGRMTGSVDGTPEQLLADEELRRDIARAIRALSTKLRDTLLLAQSEEYSYEEIATMLKAPVGTIKWRVSEARRMVKRFLEDRGYSNV